MRDVLVLLLFVTLIGGAIFAGGRPRGGPAPQPPSNAAPTPAPDSSVETPAPLPPGRGIPSVGSVQVLNGCGKDLAGVQVADYLRGQGFDVKNVDNASSWNYPATIVVSRTGDMRNARKVAKALSTEKVIMLRTGEDQYDVVVIIGPDYRERIR